MVTYSSINRKLSISEMAQINDITRQTLIYYDKIDLFKPDITEPNGYRYYSTLQIPLLREICFLRSIGMPLDEIRKNNKYNNSTTTIELLDAQNAKLDAEIHRLAAQKQKIEERIQVYQQPNEYDGSELSSPRVQHFPERHLIYHAWNKSDLTRHGLHFALMKAWNESERYDLLPSSRYGTLIFQEDLQKDRPLQHAGCGCIIDADECVEEASANIHVLQEGEYVCLQRFGMPYEPEPVRKLRRWIDRNGFEIVGNIFDECLMDGSFYESENEPDFCELQIPVRRRA